MFCPNCGNKVEPNDNYCKVCGKNLKNVKVQIVSSNSEQKKEEEFKDKTIVFKPLKDIDSIDNTKELKEIIKKVDETVKTNIENYKKSSDKTLAEDQNLKKEIDSKLEEDKIKKDVKKEISPKKDKIKETSKISLNKEKSTSSNKTKKEETKKSFMDKVRDFLDEEDDDEFSIFENRVKPDSDINVTLTNLEPVNIENTMSIPKAEIESRLKDDPTVDKENLISSEFSEVEKLIKDNKEKNLDSKKEEQVDKVETTKKEFRTPIKREEKHADPKHISSKDFYEEVNRALEENKNITSTKKEEKNSFPLKKLFNKDKKKEKNKKEKLEKKVVKEKVKSKKDKEPKVQKVNEVNKKASGFLFTLEKRLDFKDKNLRNGIIGIIFLLNVLAVMLAFRKLTIAILVLPLIKIPLTLCEHYYPLDIATNKVSFLTDSDEVNQKSFVNWALCQVLMFVLYIINPIGGFFSYTSLEALTPGIFSTIILILFTSFIAVSLYKDRIRDEKINFLGWYVVPFIVFEMLLKLLFLLVDFLAKSFLI